jgi:hypothetical protein
MKCIRLKKPRHQQNKNTTKILSPIKSGYVQHTSPNLPKPTPTPNNTKHSHTTEERRKGRRHNKEHFKMFKTSSQIYRPKQSRRSKTIYRKFGRNPKLQEELEHSIQQVLPIQPNRMGNATLPATTKINQNHACNTNDYDWLALC